MKLVVISNLYTPHQVSLCRAFSEQCSSFAFVETMVRDNSKLPAGWRYDGKLPDFVYPLAKEVESKRLIDEADVVIMGAASVDWVKKRHKEGKLVFRYSERIYKKGLTVWEWMVRMVLYHFRYNRYRNDFLLAASAYAPLDYSRTNSYIGKSYKWGYFPLLSALPLEGLRQRKSVSVKVRLLWAGRMIDWKHPEKAVMVAERLRSEGVDFSLTMVGNGPKENEINRLVNAYQLNDVVVLAGGKSPEAVKAMMEEADIFLFTSDYQEGWGAVLNEAMGSACAVVASHAIGATNFLVHHGVNGLVYQDDDFESLYNAARSLAVSAEYRTQLGSSAYLTIHQEWNADVAACRFIELAKSLLEGKAGAHYVSGPCSKADIVKHNWFLKNA